jgi:hypothetical protein
VSSPVGTLAASFPSAVPAQRYESNRGGGDRKDSGHEGERPAPAAQAPRHRVEKGDGALLRHDLDDAHGLWDSLQPFHAPLEIADSGHGTGEVNDGLARKHLARAGERAQPRGHVQRASSIALADRDRLTGVDPDANTAWEPPLADDGL